MQFADYVITKLNNGDASSILLYGHGGVGKTHALLDLYGKLQENACHVDNKLIVPLYVPLNEFLASGISNQEASFIRKYIWSKYTGQVINEDTINNLDAQILNAPESAYHFLLLCDGINEASDSRLLTSEIKRLSAYANTTVYVTSRTKMDMFNDFDCVELLPLSTQQVRDILARHGEGLQNEDALIGLLQTPFYLNLWLRLRDKDKHIHRTKSALIDAHIKDLKARQTQHNSAKCIPLGEGYQIDYSTAVEQVEWFLWALSWVAESANIMALRVSDDIWNKAKGLYPEEMYLKSLIVRLEERLFEDFLVPLGLFKKVGDDLYAFSHQIYRDFFAAKFLQQNTFGKFETKLAHNNLSDSVIDLFGGFFGDENKRMYRFLHETNERIGKVEELKQSAVVNRNIVRLFAEASNTIDGEDFSGRDLTQCDFARFDRVRKCRFENANLSHLSFSFGTGDVYAGTALPLNDELVLLQGLHSFLVLNTETGKIEQHIEHITAGFTYSLCAGLVEGEPYIFYLSVEAIPFYNTKRKEWGGIPFYSLDLKFDYTMMDRAKLYVVQGVLYFLYDKSLYIIEDIHNRGYTVLPNTVACWEQDGELFSQHTDGSILNHSQKKGGILGIKDAEILWFHDNRSATIVVTNTTVLRMGSGDPNPVLSLDDSMEFQEVVKLGSFLYLYASNAQTLDLWSSITSQFSNYEELTARGFKEIYVAVNLNDFSVTFLNQHIITDNPCLLFENLGVGGDLLYKHLIVNNNELYMFNPYQKNLSVLCYDPNSKSHSMTQSPFLGRVVCKIKKDRFLVSVLQTGYFIVGPDLKHRPVFYDRFGFWGDVFYDEKSKLLHTNNLWNVFSYDVQDEGLRLVTVEDVYADGDYHWKSARFFELENKELYDLYAKKTHAFFDSSIETSNASRLYGDVLLTRQFAYGAKRGDVFAYRMNAEDNHWEVVDGKYVSECVGLLLVDNKPMAVGICVGENRLFVLNLRNSVFEISYIDLSKLPTFNTNDLFCNQNISFLVSHEDALIWSDNESLYVLDSLAGFSKIALDVNRVEWIKWDNSQNAVLLIETAPLNHFEDLFSQTYSICQMKTVSGTIRRDVSYRVQTKFLHDCDITGAWLLDDGILINFDDRISAYDTTGKLKFESYPYNVALTDSTFSKSDCSDFEKVIIAQNGGRLV